jgi:nicotinamide mononucleotide transporter
VTDILVAVLATISFTEVAAVFLAVSYLILAIRQNIYCWVAAFISSSLYIGLFFIERLYMESILQIFYAIMAIYGWHQWPDGIEKNLGIEINTWSLRRHAAVVVSIGGLSLLFGWGMSHTDSVFPFVDSFTTVAAIIATYMVTRKVLENWIYWFVIDGVSIYLYFSRELYLTAFLFLVYLVLIVIGFRTWWRKYCEI